MAEEMTLEELKELVENMPEDRILRIMFVEEGEDDGWDEAEHGYAEPRSAAEYGA